jgi:hypothetical protein
VGVDRALVALARGDSTLATARLHQLDRRLAAEGAVRARASVLAIGEALAEHAAFFEGHA